MEKVSEQDRQKYLDLREEYANLVMDAGRIYLKKLEVERSEHTLLEELREYQERSTTLLEGIESKYGEEFFELINEDS